MARPLLPPHVAWPLAIVTLLVAGMGSAFAVLYFARSDGGAEVKAGYYEEAVRWDSVATLRNALSVRGWALRVDTETPGAIEVVVVDAEGLPVDAGDLVLRLYRPAVDAPLGTHPLNRTGPGAYRADVPAMRPGLWDVEVVPVDSVWFTTRVRRELAP